MNYLLTLISGVLTGLAMPGNLFSFFIGFLSEEYGKIKNSL
jgi:apolipoprotein N-acyltransferase